MSKENHNKSSLADAPKSVQLAVDLIQLLEENQIETDTAVEALSIALNDFKQKAARE
ncbi:YbaM family protein [Psychromonas aquimarina]|uniref:YbaM family protein n=1 Tax=Psychromonas aquimarina TaxID=444919 RepID=UPI0004290AFA|nr:YbaM family protein [Psychromonas aquimarina]